jgi:hypothetical protein
MGDNNLNDFSDIPCLLAGEKVGGRQLRLLEVNKKRFDCLVRVVSCVFRGETILKGELFFGRKYD